MAIQIKNSFAANLVSQPGSSITFGPWALTAGRCVVFAVSQNNNTYPAQLVSGVSDTAGNTWYFKETLVSPDGQIQFWYCYNCRGNASNTITVTFTNSLYRQCGYLWELSGVASGDPTDATMGGGNAGISPVTTLTFGTQQANELVLSFAAVGASSATATFNAGSGFTLDSGTVGNNSGHCAGAQHQFLTTQQLYETAPMSFSGYSGQVGAVIGILSVKDAIPGSALSTDFGSWNRVGYVAPFGQPSVLYETGAHILSTSNPIFKMWTFTESTGKLIYQESFDGITWVPLSTGPFTPGGVSAYWGKIIKYSGTYYLYANPTYGGFTAIDVWTSSDGLSWTHQKSNALGNYTQLGFLGVVSGTWYGYCAYAGVSNNWSLKEATSSDGTTWALGSTAIAALQPSNAFFTNRGSTYYFWSQGELPNYPQANAEPSDLFLWSAASPSGPWTSSGFPVIYRTAQEEGVVLGAGPGYGQVADPTLVEANGNVYLYATYTSNGADAEYNVECFIAYNTTIAQLVASNQGLIDVPVPADISATLSTQISDSFASSLSANWHQLSSASGFCAARWLSANKIGAVTVGDNADSYNNAQTWYQDQWAQITVETCAAGSTVGVSLRQNTSGTATAYRFYWTGTAGSPGTFKIDYCAAGVSTTLGTGTITVALGDTLAAAVIANNLMFYQNGYLLDVVQDSNITSGSPGFLVNPVSSTTNAAIGSFASGNLGYSITGNAGVAGTTVSYTSLASGTGSTTADGLGNFTFTGLANDTYTITPSLTGYTFSPTSASETVSGADVAGVNFTATQQTVYSVPDCRNYGIFPNTGITVQSTVQYTGQTSSNPNIPPTDSRTAGPVQDCRQAVNIPQNCRTQPPFD